MKPFNVKKLLGYYKSLNHKWTPLDDDTLYDGHRCYPLLDKGTDVDGRPVQATGDVHVRWQDSSGNLLDAPEGQFVHPTKFLTGYMRDVVMELAEIGFHLTRARILILEPGSEIPIHADSTNPRRPLWRLHIPIVSNSNAWLEWYPAGKSPAKTQFKADGSAYLFNAAIPHRAVNFGKKDRVHFVAPIRKMPKLFAE